MRVRTQNNPFIVVDVILGAVFGVVFGVLTSVVYLVSVVGVLVIWHSQHTAPHWVGLAVFFGWGWIVASAMVKSQPVESGVVAALWAFVGGVFVPLVVLWIATSAVLNQFSGDLHTRVHQAIEASALTSDAWLHSTAALWCGIGSAIAAVVTWLFDFRRRRMQQYWENPDPRLM